VKQLLEKVANTERDAALPLAAAKGYTDVVKLLLERGANIEAMDNHGNTALFSAAALGRTEVVKLLLEKGAE
jgi:ankyrin repeat protein